MSGRSVFIPRSFDHTVTYCMAFILGYRSRVYGARAEIARVRAYPAD